jgi:hypothetical protein
MGMNSDENEKRGETGIEDRPAEIPVDRLIAEIVERAHQVSLERGEIDRIAFAEWKQAEREVRKKYRI